jgi:putative Mn2+ efflux pump MntP
MKKIVGIVLLTVGIAQANETMISKEQPVHESEQSPQGENKKQSKTTVKRIEKCLAAGLLAGIGIWTLKQLHTDYKNVKEYKGDSFRRSAYTAFSAGAVAYLTLRCGSYMLKSVHKMVFK